MQFFVSMLFFVSFMDFDSVLDNLCGLLLCNRWFNVRNHSLLLFFLFLLLEILLDFLLFLLLGLFKG